MKFTKYIVPGMKEERGTKKVNLLMGEGSTMEEDLVGIIRGERKEKLPKKQRKIGKFEVKRIQKKLKF